MENIPIAITQLDREKEMLVQVTMVMTDKRKINKTVPSETDPEYIDKVVITWKYLDKTEQDFSRITIASDDGDKAGILSTMDLYVKYFEKNYNVRFLEYLHTNKG